MRSIAATVAAFACALISLHANVVIPAEFREIVRESTLIVRGHVTDVRAEMTPGRGVESIATVAVESRMKGDSNSFVYVRVPGGQLGRSRVIMTGSPTFQAGQRAVFFLRSDGADSTMRPVGLSQGIYRIQPEPRTGRAVVAPPLITGVTEARSGAAVRGDARRKLLPVSEFEGLVRLVMTSSGTAAVPRRGVR